MFFGRRMRGRVTACVILCLCSIFILSACSAPWQRGSKASANNVPRPTVKQLLTAVQKNFSKVTAFHVVMQVQDSGPAAPDQIQIRNATGNVVMPDKVKAQATVILSGQSVTVNLISVDGNQFITDPITGQWRVIKGVLDPRTLTNPKTGLISLISKVEKVTKPTSAIVNGNPCWRIRGQLDAKYIAFFTGGGVPAGTKLKTSACIGKLDSLPYQVIVTGRAAVNDTAKTSYRFDMTDYNQKVSITSPM